MVTEIRTVPRSRRDPQSTATRFPATSRSTESATSTSQNSADCAADNARPMRRRALLDQRELPQLRRLRDRPRVPRGAAGARRGRADGDHVRGTRLVGCQRRIIADDLLAAGFDIFHINGPRQDRTGAHDAGRPMLSGRPDPLWLDPSRGGRRRCSGSVDRGRCSRGNQPRDGTPFRRRGKPHRAAPWNRTQLRAHFSRGYFSAAISHGGPRARAFAQVVSPVIGVARR